MAEATDSPPPPPQNVCVRIWAARDHRECNTNVIGWGSGSEMVPGWLRGVLVDSPTVLHLYDTATRSVRELALREPGKVSIYLCGPTVYGPPHLGHGRATLVYDIMRRYLEWTGLDVRLVSNITDIEDKIIERAVREGRPWQDITTKCEAIWWQAMDAVNFERPSDTPHATDYVDEMDPADFVLWKFATGPETPSDPAWPSPWGAGRPGWHSECVVMSLDLLGEGFDLHCGGQDLRFPHHENERAQAVALGKTFANHWMHNGFVVDAEGEKMSKSLGNVSNLLDLVEHYDPRAYRMVLLQSHYRSPVKITQDGIDAAVKSLAGLDAFAARVAGVDADEPDAAVIAEFRAAMDDDLDTPRATALLFDTVRRANAALDSGDDTAGRLVAAVHEIAGAVGLTLGSAVEADADALARAQALDDARAAKDFAAADALRAELQADGWTVETTRDGTSLRR